MDATKYNDHVQALRKYEFPQLLGATYLDHAGTTLYAQSLIEDVSVDLKSNLFGNPHSQSQSSVATTIRVDNVRRQVLEYLHASPDHFDVVFVANATAAIKLVASSFQTQNFWYGYHKDAHSSLVGVRELAESSRCFTSPQELAHWTLEEKQDNVLELIAYPAQSNMSGYRLPLSWPRSFRATHTDCYILLDAASYLTTGQLDLASHDEAPDFIAISFYKIFGYPDLGALIVRRRAYDVLRQRKYFGGGTVDMIIDLDESWHATKTTSLHDALEDGTLPFHNIIALGYAIEARCRIFGLPKQISDHTAYLSSYLFTQLSQIHHHNASPLVEIYKEAHATYGDGRVQGPIMAFNLLVAFGTYIGKTRFEELASACAIHVRSGGVCNPGGIASMLGLQAWEMHRNFSEGVRCGNEIDIVGGKPTGIMRVSLGAMSTTLDIDVFTQFLHFFFVENTPERLSRMTTLQQDFGTTGRPYRQPIEANHRSEEPCITPVINCAPFYIPHMPGDCVAEKRKQYDVWHHQWQLFDPELEQPLVFRESETNHLKAAIEAKAGVLRIMQHGMPDLAMSIWRVPVEQDKAQGWVTYADPSVSLWLSNAIGRPCTLARWYGRSLADERISRQCVVSWCSRQFGDRKELPKHYSEHAIEFEDFLHQKMLYRKNVVNDTSPSRPETREQQTKGRQLSSSPPSNLDTTSVPKYITSENDHTESQKRATKRSNWRSFLKCK